MTIINVLKREMRDLNMPSAKEFDEYEDAVIRHNFRISGLDRVVIQDDEDQYEYDREDEPDDTEDYDF